LSVTLERGLPALRFRFECDLCGRDVAAAVLPPSWGLVPLPGGGKKIECGPCRFDEIAAELGWTEAAA
jgi:hypothetical protein